MPPSNIRITREECELHVQFKLDDLDTYFSRSATPSRYTDSFGPGLRFGSYSFVDANEPRQLGIYLYTAKGYPPLSINFTVTARSLSGELYFTKTMSYNFKSGEAIGWSKFLNLETYQNTRGMKEENVMVVHAVLKFAPLYPVVSMPTLKVVHRTINGSESTDMRYVVYARRNKSGRLGGVRMLFGTRDGLTQKSATGDDVFETGVSQLSGLVLSASERPRSHTFTQYTDDDSDFEDDDETISEEVDLRLSVRTPSIPTGPRMSLLSRIDATDSIAVKSEGDTSMSGPSTLALSSSQTQLIDLPAYGGSTILITGVAADTWEAVLYWLYTGTIQFAPLTSEGRSQRETAVKVARQANPDRPPPVSCKSVYRIADALKLESLKKQALAHLEHRLSMQTYLDEVFSDFTSKYEEVRKLEMLAVIKHWDQIKNSSALRTKMVDIATGKLPHAGSVMADLLMKASVKDTDADPTVGERESNQRSGSSGGVGRKRSLEV